MASPNTYPSPPVAQYPPPPQYRYRRSIAGPLVLIVLGIRVLMRRTGRGW